MSAPTNHWKLGLFVVVSVMVGLSALVYVGAQALQKETVSYKSYFDEAVSGLEIGASVSFRGVKLGNVSAIDVAPDRRHVEISYELGVSELGRLGLAAPHGQSTKIKVPQDLRVQLASNGITGVKYIQIDFFPLKTNPLPALPFPVPPNYIPATASTMKNIEDAVVRAADAVPELARDMTVMLAQVNSLLGEVRNERLPEKAGAALDGANQVFASLDTKLKQLEIKELSDDARAAVAKLNGALDKANAVLAHMDGDKGLMVSVQRASNNIGDVAANVRGLELGGTLSDVREAAQALRDLISALERDPDMLVKGRAKVSE